MASYAKKSKGGIFWTILMMGFFAILSSTMSKNPVLKPFASSLETPTGFWMGFVASASTIPGMLVSLPAASLSDIFGRRKMLLVSAVVFASAPFLYLLIVSWWQLILVRFYHGFATAIFVPVAEASIAERAPSRRGEWISVFSSVTAVGRGIAPFLGGYILSITDYSYHTLYLAVAVAGATALITALLFLVEEGGPSIQAEVSRETFRRMFRGWRNIAGNHGALIASYVQASQYYAYGAVEYFLVGYLNEVVQFDPFLIGVIMGSQIVILILVKPYMGRVSDKIGRRIPIVAGCIVGGLPLIALPFTADFWTLLLLSAVYGLGFATVTASTPALVSDLTSKEFFGTAMGFLDTIMDVGQTLGPIISGLILATSLRYVGVFSSLTLMLLFSCISFVLAGTARDTYSR